MKRITEGPEKRNESDPQNPHRFACFGGYLRDRAQSAGPHREGRHLDRPAVVFLVAGQSNANGCGVLSPEIHVEDGLAQRRPLIPGTTAIEIGLPIQAEAYSHSYIWVPDEQAFQAVDPSRNLFPPKLDKRGHGMELPVVRELEKRFPANDIFVIKYARGGSNLYRHWNPENTHPEQGSKRTTKPGRTAPTTAT